MYHTHAQSFYDDFSISPPPPKHMWYLPQGHWPGFGEQVKANRLLPRHNSTQLTFFKIPQILHVLPVRDIIRTL